MGNPRVSRLFAVGILALMACACSSPSDPVTEIEANIEAMQTALAERDNGGFSEHLVESFLGGKNDRLDIEKAEARKMLTAYFLRYKNIHVVVTQLDIEMDEVDPDLARMTGTVAVGGANRSLPESGGLYAIKGEWRNYDGNWQLRYFNWR